MKKTEKKSLLDEKFDEDVAEKKLAPSNPPKRRSVKKKVERPAEKSVEEPAAQTKTKARKSKPASTKAAKTTEPEKPVKTVKSARSVEKTKPVEKADASTAKSSAKPVAKSPAKRATVKTTKAKASSKSTKTTKSSKEAKAPKETSALEKTPGREAVLAEIMERIAKVPLSEEEKKRRATSDEAPFRASTPAEKAYSGRLPLWKGGWLVLKGARKNNLHSVDVPFPLGAFTVVTGVSGSGKSSLVEDAFYESLQKLRSGVRVSHSVCDDVVGWESLKKISKVDQSPIGQTPTSNPATYVGVFEWIRTLFAQTPEARALGFHARRFSFNAPGGRCEACEGAGQIKIEMQFLADVWVTCEACGGKRYNAQTLSVRYRGKTIADVLEMTCGEALEFFSDVPKIKRYIQTLCDVGLDYLPLGQSSTTLSGGEAQRVKLATELSRLETGDALYILDEPTTGLHFSDVSKLLDVLQKLVDLGNTVVVVEHNLDVIKCADWIVDVGPEAGIEGGEIVFAGTPEGLLEYVAKRESSEELRRETLRSHTGESLFSAFERGVFYEREPLDVDAYLNSLKKESQAAVDVETPLVDNSQPMWEIDGRRWHMVLQKPRVGERRRWDPQILSAIADKIEDEMENVDVDWSDRVTVEARDARSGAWFMRAVTNDEWLLKIRFRAARDAFDKDKLPNELGIKPLSEVAEIPLYGIKPRTRVDFIGGRQEIEIKVFSYNEVDTPAFWNFLETAMKSFAKCADEERAEDVDLTPWITQGREWHLSSGGAYGRGKIGDKWTFDELREILDIFEKTNGSDGIVWKNKIVVDFLNPYGVPWARIYTKNAAFIRILLYFPLGWSHWDLVEETRFDSTEEQASATLDSVSMIYDGEDDLGFNRSALKACAKEAREAMLDVESFDEEF